MRPLLRGIEAAVEDLVAVRAGQVGVEGDVEGEVDEVARHGGVGAHGGGRGEGSLARGRSDGQVVLRVRSRHAEAHRGRHLLPPMPGLAGEVGDLVHVREGEVWAARAAACEPAVGGDDAVAKRA